MDENLSTVLGEIFADLQYIPEKIICLTTYLFYMLFHANFIKNNKTTELQEKLAIVTAL